MSNSRYYINNQYIYSYKFSVNKEKQQSSCWNQIKAITLQFKH